MDDVELIPRRVIFGNPERTSVEISPDGTRIAFLSPRDGVLNVWVAPRERIGEARPVTRDTTRGIRWYSWAYTNQHVLYLQDEAGDENWRITSVDIDSGRLLGLTPFENTQAQLWALSPRIPEEIVVGLNNRDPKWHDVHRVNIVTGALVQMEQNESCAGYLLDDDYRLRLAMRMTPDGGLEFLRRTAQERWEPWDSVPAADMMTTSPFGFDESGRTLYLKDSRGRETAAVVACEVDGRRMRTVAADSRVDAEDILRHPKTRRVQAVSFVHERKRWEVVDPSIADDFSFLRSLSPGDFDVVSHSLDDAVWIVRTTVDDGPARYWRYDRTRRAARQLFADRPALERRRLARMHSATIKSRDGLDLVVYWSLPPGTDRARIGVPDRPLPMVLTPHGGPWGRDFWGYDAWHQWLANRGYAVLSVNFRSSTGFGKSFTNAGDREWGGRIIEDQADGVRWAITRGIAEPTRVAVLGGSFGGYSTLAGLTFAPELYACGVDLVGPSNLLTLLASIPPYWAPMKRMFATRVGDPETEEGRALLLRHSPLTHVEQIRRPLLIAQGEHDPRVKKAEAEQIVAAMKAKGIPVTYVLYHDEGHGFARPENKQSFSAITEAFLARCLGGRYEPIGDELTGSSLEVLEGAAGVPGLPEALSRRSWRG